MPKDNLIPSVSVLQVEDLEGVKLSVPKLIGLQRILVVDDESDICFVLKNVLGENGFVVDSYDDPLTALEKFKPDFYNLVILDIRMPELNGFSLYREIKRLDKKVKVCFLTAGEIYGVYSDIFSSVPGNHFIRKPIDNEGLIASINEIIGRNIKKS